MNTAKGIVSYWRDFVAAVIASTVCVSILIKGGGGSGQMKPPVVDSGSTAEVLQPQQIAVMTEEPETTPPVDRGSDPPDLSSPAEQQVNVQCPSESLVAEDRKQMPDKTQHGPSSTTLAELESQDVKDVEKMSEQEVEKTADDYRKAFKEGQITLQLRMGGLAAQDIPRISQGFILSCGGYQYKVSPECDAPRQIKKLPHCVFMGEIKREKWPEALKKTACDVFAQNHNARCSILIATRYQLEIYRFVRDQRPENGSIVTLSVSSCDVGSPELKLESVKANGKRIS